MNPTIGRIVIYRTTEKQRLLMKSHVNCNTPEYLPAIVVAVWNESGVNLSILLDGDGTLWATSVHEGINEGEWHWPEIED